MSDVLSCCSPCKTTETVNIPGSEGADGVNGTNGINAFSTVTVQFTTPAANGTVAVVVDQAVWMVIGQNVVVGVGYTGAGSGPAHCTVTAVGPATTQCVLKYLDSGGDIGPGQNILVGSVISPAG